MVGPTLEQQGGMATIEQLIMRQPYEDVDIQHLASHDEGTVVHRLLVFSSALFRFILLLVAQRVDIVHFHVSERGSVARKSLLVCLARLFRKPVVMHTHGCEFHVFYERLPSFLQHIVVRIFQSCAYVITLSQSWKQYYETQLSLPPEHVIVLHNPVELPEQLPERKGNSTVRFAFLGRVGQRKGAFDLIKAYAQLSPEHKQCSELTLAGDGVVEQAHEMVKELDLEDQVSVLGWINPEERNQLLQSVDVFVLPSYNEGLPVAMLEAMAWGLPVITTPVGGIPEVVTHAKDGILVQPGNLEQLTGSLERLIEDEELRLKMGNNARSRVTPLSLDTYYVALAGLYWSAGGHKVISKQMVDGSRPTRPIVDSHSKANL